MRRLLRYLLPVAGSVAAAALSALSQQSEKDDRSPAEEVRAPASRRSQATAGIRGAAVDFLSDVLAETYRKVRVREGDQRSRR